jgi:hypothetical protein
MFKKILSLPNLTLLTALSLSTVAAYYSIIGLTAIFAGAVIPIIVMGSILEVGKIVTTVWLRKYWHRCTWVLKMYLVPSVVLLAFLTSMGIFGFLSKAHTDQNLVSGDVQSKIAIYDEKIKTAKENIEADRKQLKQMDEAVDQVMARSTTEEGATKSNAIRKAQARDRAALAKSIETNQKLISVLNDEAAPIRAEIRKVEAEVGPIKYIAAFIYDDNPDSNTLERAVRWVIILIVIVFDPLAIALVLAANASKEWDKEEPQYEMDDGPLTDEQVDQLKKSVEAFDKQEEVIEEPVPEKSVFEKYPYLAKPFAHFKNLKPMVGTIEEPIKEVEPVKEPTVDSTVSIAKVEPVEFITDVSKIDTEGVTILNHDHGDYIIHDGKLTHKDAVKQLNPNMFGLTVDNLKKSNTNFGTKFPEIADKGDMFVRVDILPNRVFKFDGKRWIEINKETTDTYLHDQEYIKHLVKMIDDGQYEIELLSENEQREIENYLRNQKS